MKKLLSSPMCERWPISSVAAYGLRKNKVAVSLYSWYKYAKAMGLQHPAKKADHKVVGLRATRPNEYLHIDTTNLLLTNGTKTCITVVVDNYSRMILGFNIREALSFEIVKGAIQNALRAIAAHPDQKGSFLVADGGRENHNENIDGFLQSLTDYQLVKPRALKDIQFSNSPIEAIHRILKGRYLRKRSFKTIAELRNCLLEAVFDYNERRLHYSHFPRTPKEVYFNLPLGLDPSKRMQRARKKRTDKNRAVACRNCINTSICPMVKVPVVN